ncbi:MAG: 50S ribosomal protein L6 [Candidatus Omnitrophica bacterium]|nr:50S ribosomal protein L6 [Candidatus Omnitrophota bacterium]MBI3021373.1 50S ribosomal protein L6 [Candidatus Omnitrophota bacterium]MBI3083150.1 50S ribosomal protein L6 [Candidatus Omnitrophota bacterium]
MSRIGRAPITLPSGVKVKPEGQQLQVEGPKGKLSTTLPAGMSVRQEEQQLIVAASGQDASGKMLHGLYRALIANMVQGVVSAFTKELEIVGIGYRAQLQGKQLSLHVGFSHPALVPIPEGIAVEVPKPTSIIVKGMDKQLVGQFAANLRRIAPPEPYKGKGIKYVGEIVRRKAGKAATGSGAKAAG